MITTNGRYKIVGQHAISLKGAQVQGQVFDEYSKEAVSYGHLSFNDSVSHTLIDSLGFFNHYVEAGRYQIGVYSVGNKDFHIKNLKLEEGTCTVMKIYLGTEKYLSD